MMVVVDDIHAVDTLTRSVLAALMREPNVQMLAAGESAIDGLDTVEIEALTAGQSGLPNLGGTDPAVPMHMGDAILHSARSQGILSGQGAWSATALVDGLSDNARSLLHLVTTSVVPVSRASAGRLLSLDLASLARACSSLTNRGLVVEWGGGLRLASPVDAADLEEHFGVQAALHRKASSLLGADHPGQIPHAVVSPPQDLDGLEPAFDALLDWDPASAARWGAVIIGRNPEPGLVRRTVDAAVAGKQCDVAVAVLRGAALHTDDVYLKGACLALAGLVLVTTELDTTAAGRLFAEAQSLFANNPHPPAEMYLLEARLQLESQGAAHAL